MSCQCVDCTWMFDCLDKAVIMIPESEHARLLNWRRAFLYLVGIIFPAICDPVCSAAMKETAHQEQSAKFIKCNCLQGVCEQMQIENQE